MGFVLQAHHIQPLGAAAFVHHGDGAGGQQSLGLQLFAAQAHHHHLAAKVGVQAQVAQGADGDDGVWRVNRHAAAVAMFQRHHVVHVRVARQQLLLDALHGKLGDARHALHRLRDGQDVASAHRAIGVAVALKGVALQRGQGLAARGGHGQGVQLARLGHGQQPLVHPAARRNVAGGIANRNAVAQHRTPGGQIDQRHLVALRHLVAQHQARGQGSACGQATIVGHDGDVVAVVHADGERFQGLIGGAIGHAVSYDLALRAHPSPGRAGLCDVYDTGTILNH